MRMRSGEPTTLSDRQPAPVKNTVLVLPKVAR